MENQIEEIPQINTMENTEPNTAEPAQQPKKRGRKPKIIDPNAPETVEKPKKKDVNNMANTEIGRAHV